MEEAREGNRELARFLGVSLKTACRLAKEMRENTGCVIKRRKTYINVRTGRTKFTTVNVWWPSLVQGYLAGKQLRQDEKPPP